MVITTETIIILIWEFLTMFIIALYLYFEPTKIYNFIILKNDRIKKKDVQYNRNIDIDEDLFSEYYIAYNYGFIKKRNDIIGAILLKWAITGVIKIDKNPHKNNIKNEDCIIVLKGNPIKTFKDKRERTLYNMLYDASKDGILEEREFVEWGYNNHKKLAEWLNNVLKEEREIFIKEGKIKPIKKIFGVVYVSTSEIKDKAIKLIGLKKFLTDYTIINERQTTEVVLFEKYLIYAKLLGIAKKSTKQLKKLYLEVYDLEEYVVIDQILNGRITLRSFFGWKENLTSKK